MRATRWLLVGLWALAVSVSAAWAQYDENEERIGKAAAEQVEKELKVVEDAEQVARLDRIVARLAPYAQRTEVKIVAPGEKPEEAPAGEPDEEKPDTGYAVKILETGEINAFSLPGGHIYITEGAMMAVESDDELAAIIAHEMAHNAHKDGMELLRREAKLNAQVGLAVLAAVLAGDNADPGNIALFGGLMKTAILHGYGREAEYHADHDGVVFMQKAGYNPVAMLTVIEGFVRFANMQPDVELGIFQTHPFPRERAQRLIEQLTALQVPINRRLVTRSLVVTVKEQQRDDEQTVGQVLIDDAVVFEAAAGEHGETPTERATEIGRRLSRQILDNLQVWEIQLGRGADQAAIYARGEPLVRVLPEDAALKNMTQPALAREVYGEMQLAFWREAVARAH